MNHHRRARLLLVLLSAVLFLPNLGGTDLWAPDEPNFAEVAREMLLNGHWALPHDNSTVFTDKPPLLFWLIAALSSFIGDVSSWTARLPSALAGLVSVQLTYEIGRRLMSRAAALAGGAIFCTSYLVFDKARTAQIDMLLCALILAALWSFLHVKEGGGRVWGLLFWIFSALAVLAKGPVGLILPLGTVLFFLAVRREMGLMRRLAPLTGPLLFILIVGAWMLAAQAAGSQEGYSVLEAFRRHALERFAQGMHHRQPVWYYLQALPRGLLPWSLFIPGAIVAAWSARRETGTGGAAGPVMLLCWFTLVLLFFSLSREKRDLYVLPLYPAAGLMIGLLAERGSVPGARERRWLLIPAWISSGVAALVGLLALVMPEGTARHLGGRVLGALLDAWPGVYGPARLTLVMLLPAGGAALALLMSRLALPRKTGGVLALIAAGICAAYLCVALALNPAFNAHKSARPFCETIARRVAAAPGAEGTVAIYRLYRSAFAFYSGGVKYRLLEGQDELRTFLSSRRAAFVLAVAEDAGKLKAPPGLALEIVERGRVGHREYVLLRSAPFPQGS